MKVEEKKMGILKSDTHIVLLAQLEDLVKQLARTTIIPANANISQTHALRCDFYG